MSNLLCLVADLIDGKESEPIAEAVSVQRGGPSRSPHEDFPTTNVPKKQIADAVSVQRGGPTRSPHEDFPTTNVPKKQIAEAVSVQRGGTTRSPHEDFPTTNVPKKQIAGAVSVQRGGTTRSPHEDFPTAHVPKKQKLKMGCQFDVANPFLFEIPNKNWKKVPRSFQKELMSEGPFFPGRLQYMNSIIAVYQPMDPVTVCTVAKSLRIPHGHFTTTAPAYKFPEECCIPIHTVYPKRESFPQVSTDFQFIEARIIDDLEIPWQDLGKLLWNRNCNVDGKLSSNQRQSHWKDGGYGGGRAFSREMANHRISCPSLLDGTMDPLMIRVLCTMTKVIHANCPHIWCDRSMERLTRYAQRINQGNIIEYLRIAATEVTGHSSDHGLCGFHDDDLNDPNFSEVVIVSRVIQYENIYLRVSLIAATRKSIWDAECRENKAIGPSIRFLIHRYECFDVTRKSIHQYLLTTTNNRDSWCGIGFGQYPCHLHSCVYVSPLVHFTLRMIHQFRIDFVEVVCIFRSFALCSNTTFFVTAALIELLQRQVMSHTGLHFGYHLLQRVHEISTSYKKSKKPIPGTRPSKNTDTPLPPFDQFKDQMKHMIFFCVQSFECINAPTNKKTRAHLYNKILKGLKACLPSCGVSGTNNLINAMSMVGVLPSWYSFEIEGAHEARGFQFLNQEFGLTKGEQGTGQLLDTLTRAVEDVSGKFCLRRHAENIVSNVFRSKEKGEKRFSDLLWAEQYIYEPTKTGIMLWKEDSTSVSTDAPLVIRWPYDSTLKSGYEIYMEHESMISKGHEHASIDRRFQHTTRTAYMADFLQKALEN